MKKIISFVVVLVCLMFLTSGCEDVQRIGESIKSSTVGIKRKVVWTGFDGTKKVWTGKFKVDSNEGSPTIYFVTNDGRVVILGPGYYIEEVK